MKLFNRKKTQPGVHLPPEVQAYSQAERRERMGMAWLVGIVSLLVSLLVVAGLFFGGRWVYRKVAHRDKPTPVVTETTNDDQAQTDDDKPADDTPATNDNANNGGGTDAPSTSGNSGSTNPAPTEQPVTGDQAAELPNTGPDQDL